MHILLRTPNKCRILTGAFHPHVCIGITVVANKNHSPKALHQKKLASYYTNPLITGTQHVIETFHDYSMLPWCGAIIGGTVALRLALTLPLALKQHKTLAQMELLQPELEVVLKHVKSDVVREAKENGKSEKEINILIATKVATYTKDFYESHNISKRGLFLLPWTQLPLWILISLAMRNISGYGEQVTNFGAIDSFTPSFGIDTGGLLWLTDLSVADPYYVIPAVLFLTNYLNIQLNALRAQKPSRFNVIVTRSCEVLTVLITYISIQLPAAMTLYWATSSTYGLAQNIAMKYPKVRRLLGIPKTPSEPEDPVAHYRKLIRTNMDNFVKSQREDERK